MIDVLAGLETGGDGVDGVEEGVANPVAGCRDEGDLNCVDGLILEFFTLACYYDIYY